MLKLSDVLLLGDDRLRMACDPVNQEEVHSLQSTIEGMYQIIKEFKKRYGAGRAIAAPQVGCMKRFVCMYIDQPQVFFNPHFTFQSEEMFELWDDCMSFPNLMVRLKRHKKCIMTYYDVDWIQHEWIIIDDMAELMQHELDHLDGVLAIDRALDKNAFRWRAFDPYSSSPESSD